MSPVMGFDLSSFLSAIPSNLWRLLTLRFDKSPVETVEALVEFVHTRAAYVAQTSLYGYLKTRMGIRYPAAFEDELMSRSISIAKWHVYAACLSDLTLFATATTMRGHDMSRDEAGDLARFCFKEAARRTFENLPDEAAALVDTAPAAFSDRVDAMVWPAAASGENAFTLSPGALIEWAPIADELKRFDKEIVTNSIRYRWRDVREQLRKRLDGEALCADWRARRGA